MKFQSIENLISPQKTITSFATVIKIKNIFTILAIVCILVFPKTNFAQAPNLGSLYNFILFTKSGAIPNTGQSNITGNIGTGSGAITSFGAPSTVNGNIYNDNTITTQAAADLEAVYEQLAATAATTPHLPVFGNGETIYAGVYSIGGAGSMAGVLTLDAKSDTNAVFIFKFDGAFNTGETSSIILVNGASAGNVFWLAEGAVGMAALTSMAGTIIAHNGAASMGAGCTLNGRMFSTTGALAVYASNATLPPIKLVTVWTGNAGTTDWFTTANWTMSVPTAAIAVVIPGTLTAGNLFPIITGAAFVDSLTIISPASVTILNSTLQIKGTLTNNGMIDASNGTIALAGLIPQIIPANAFAGNSILNLLIGNNVTLTAPLSITGVVAFAGNNNTFSTGGYLTLKSTAVGTASIADITNAGFNSGNTIKGNIIIERYIPAKRAWRLLSAPVTAIGAPTIHAAWQEAEGSGSSTVTPGYGTQITGGTIANGFDAGINYKASIKVFSNNNFVALPPTPGTNTAINNYPGYFLFVRGNRNTNLQLGINAATSNTTLRITGQVNMGSISSNINAAGLTLVGNPYASSINFHSLTKNNVNDKFYIWDAKLGGTSGYGGYVTLLWNGSSYDTTPADSSASQRIESGSAFFIESLDGTNPGTLTINETDKNTGSSAHVFREMATAGKIRVNILSINTDSTTSLLDGVLTTYDDNSDNAVNRLDAKKLYNLAEVIVIDRSNNFLSIERRHTIATNDTTALNLYRLKRKEYQLQFTTTALAGNGLTALLKDNYSAVLNNKPVNLNGITEITFTVNKDSGSFAPNRFSIVFERKIVAVVSFTDVRAYWAKKNIVVAWTNTTEREVKNYEIQELRIGSNATSTSSNDYITAAKITAKSTVPGTETYNWTDVSATDGTHYYRIKSTSLDGKITFSTIVQVTIVASTIAQPGLVVYGNIMQGNTLSVQFNNLSAGKYKVLLYTNQGQIIKELTVTHGGAQSELHSFTIESNIAAGRYQLQLSGNLINLTTSIIKN